MSWKKECSNCEHTIVCGRTDVDRGEICEHWSGWIPSEVELPKEEKEYMVIDRGRIEFAGYSFDLSKISRFEFGEEVKPGFYYWCDEYGWVSCNPKYWRPVIAKPEG